MYQGADRELTLDTKLGKIHDEYTKIIVLQRMCKFLPRDQVIF